MAAGNDDLTARIETVTSDDPHEIRSDLVTVLREVVPSNLALFFKCATDSDGQRYFTGVAMTGDDDAMSMIDGFADRPALETPWLPRHAEPEIVNNFVRIRSHYDDEYLRSFEVQKVVFEPMEADDQLRTVLCDGSRFLGWLGLVRRGVRARFRSEEEQTIQRAAGTIKAVLATAEALEAESLADELFAVARPDGVIEHASDAFRLWLDTDRRRHLAGRVRRVDAGHAAAGVEILDGAEVRLVRLDGPTGVRYAVTVDKAELLRLRPEEWLTPRQREVAKLAMAGATNAEIGDVLGVARETAKSHLKQIYRRLQVSNRTELAVMLSHLEC